MTDQPATTLTGLSRSRLQDPAITNIFGGTSQGFDQSDRTYDSTFGASPLSFQITASDNNPIHNL